MGHGEHSHQQHGHYQHELAVPPDHRRWAELVLLCLGVVERRMTARLMRPQMLARRPVLSGTFLMLTATGLPLGLFFLTSLYFQHARGIGALQTGLIFLPVAAQLIGKVGGRPTAVAGFVLTAAAPLLTQIDATGNAYPIVLAAFVLAALGIGLLVVTATAATMADVPPGAAAIIALGLAPAAGRSPASATTTERLGRPERIRSCRSPSCSIQG